MNENDGSVSDAAEALLRRWMPDDEDDDKKSSPSETEDEAPNPTKAEDDEDDQSSKADESDQDDTDPDESDDEDGDSDDDADTGNSVTLSDDTKIKHKVNGVEQEFTLGQLKRLAGQEAALTQRSQELSEKTKVSNTVAETNVALLARLQEKAAKRWEPFSKINWVLEARNPNVTTEEIQAAQEAAQAAYEDYAFYTQELEAFSKQVQSSRAADLTERAKACVKALSDPETGIKGWSREMFEEIQNFATSTGIQREVMDELVDPAAFKILHMAMMYSKGKAATKTLETDKKKAPKKIVKSGSTPPAERGGARRTEAIEKATKRLKATGSPDDAAELMLARWGKDSSE